MTRPDWDPGKRYAVPARCPDPKCAGTPQWVVCDDVSPEGPESGLCPGCGDRVYFYAAVSRVDAKELPDDFDPDAY